MAGKIFFSQHALDRVQERHDRWLLPYKDYVGFSHSAYEFLERATWTNRHLNDSVFMLRYWEKYGYDGHFRFKEWKNALFVIVGTVVVTVLDTDHHHMTRQHGYRQLTPKKRAHYEKRAMATGTNVRDHSAVLAKAGEGSTDRGAA